MGHHPIRPDHKALAMSRRHLLPILLLALAASPVAHAQYKWRDSNGRMVYSDLPPPASVAPSAVLWSPARPALAGPPGGSGAPATPQAAAPDSATAVAAPNGLPASEGAASASMADRELEFRKRRLDRAAAQEKAEQAQVRETQRAGNCESAQASLRQLDSGMRISRVNRDGQPEVLDDAQREASKVQARQAVKQHCSAS
jgi:hypothetical protein